MNDTRNDQVRWGILSTARIGAKAVTPAIQASNNGIVAAVASRNEARAVEYAAQFGIARQHASYEALLADPEVDVIYNPLPNSMHLEWTIKALEAGKHVLCEKPLGLTAAECLAMADAATLNDRLLMEAFMYRFHPRIKRTQELLAAGQVGDVKLIRSAFSFMVADPQNVRLDADLGGGSLLDVGCYCVNASRTLLGSEPLEAQAFAVNGATGVDLQLVGVLRFAGDVFAQFNCGFNTAREELLEVVGTTGKLRLDSAFLPGSGDVVINLEDATGSSEESVKGVNQYQLMVTHFADCILQGTQPRYSVRDAAANLAALDALRASAAQGGRPEPVRQLA